MISGLNVEFDGSVKSKLLSPKYTNFDCAINLNLGAISLDGKKGGAVNAAFRDYVTHIYGSYTGKFEAMGFKTSTGKMYMVGDIKRGTPFVIGKYGEKFHGLKIGLKEGISSIRPVFKKGWFSSTVPKDDDDYHEDDLIDDEVQIQNLNGAELEFALYYADEDDNIFQFNDPEDNPPGESYDKVVFGEEQEKVPASQFFTETDFSSIKKKVLNLIKPNKTQKQIQEEERKKQEILNKQIEEHMKQKKKNEEEVKSKLEKPVNLADILPKGTPIYFAQEIPKKGGFVDKHFPNDARSLFGGNGEARLPENVGEDEIEDWDKISFVRAKDIFGSDNYQVFMGKIEPGDILQGSLGNCYFLSAIATIAEEAPDMIKRRFLSAGRSSDGIYAVMVRVTGMWKIVLVDDSMPAKKNCGSSEFAFTRANGPELWVVLLEKVWAKLCGGYVNIIGGMPSEVFNTFTHAYTESLNIKRVAEEVLWQKLLEGEKKNYLMSAGTGQKGGDKGLTPGHAYSLLRAKEVTDHGVKTRLVELRNPWGEGEWSGEWSDSSDKWTKQLKEECQVSTAEDGKFWMNLKDFMTYYEVCNICKIQKNWHDVQLNLNKSHTEQHLVSVITVEEDTKAYIQIHQKYKRFILKDGSYPKQTIFNLWLLDNEFNFVESVWSDSNIDCIEAQLKKGTYYTLSDINYRLELENTKRHGYSISVYSEKPCKIELAKDLVGDEILKKALISYARTKLKPIIPNELKDLKREDAKCYKKTINNPFPGHVYVFDNQSKDMNFEGLVRLKDCNNAGIYDFQTHNIINDSHHYSVEVKAGTTEVVYIRYTSNEPKISYIEEKVSTGEYCNMSLLETEEMIQQHTWEKGTKAEVEAGSQLFEYTLQHKKGFGIGFENKSKKKYSVSVEWELNNLVLTSKRGESTVEFTLEPGQKYWAFLAIVNSSRQSSYEEGIGYEAV